jgi:uncharacterized coiled-coil protein SlyX
MSTNNGFDRRARLLELAMAIGTSAITSAVVVSWSLSATLADLRAKSDQQASQITSLSTTLQMMQSNDSAQSERIAKAEAHYEDIMHTLSEIKAAVARR